MMYLLKHTKHNFTGRFFKILAMLILTLIFVLVANYLSSLLFGAFSPLLRAGNYFYKTFDSIPGFFSDRIELAEKNAVLLDEIENYRLNAIDYESIKYENQKLREDLKMKPNGNFLTASILAKPPQIPLDSLFLDNGVENGVKIDDFVLASDRILIGKIVKVSPNRSTAALNSFAGITTYGYVARTNEPIEIKGAGGGSIETKVPIDFDITVGDKIMVSGSLSFLAAIVGAIEEDHSSGFKKILMSLPTNASKLSFVFLESFIKE